MRRGKKERRGDEDGKEDEMKHLCFGRNGCCMLLRFAWQLALPLQAFMRLPLLAISESYHCEDW